MKKSYCYTGKESTRFMFYTVKQAKQILKNENKVFEHIEWIRDGSFALYWHNKRIKKR